MNKRLMFIGGLLCSMVVIGSFYSTQVAQAHFDVEDSTTRLKSNFHVTPDHSPIAGKESVISYDFSKNGHQTDKFTYSLKINKIRESEVVVPASVTRNVVLANYVFPTQGLYTITLTITPKDSFSMVSVLTYNQRVSRGEIAEHKGFGMFEIGVFAVVFGAIGIVFVITFRDILKKNRRNGDK